MFARCISLTQAPELPATTLAEGCYDSMFAYCYNLTQAPSILPATVLADYCYFNMFGGCINLTQAPELPATTLAANCYYNMFVNCSSPFDFSSKTIKEVLSLNNHDCIFGYNRTL
jgi:hypothetical protein